MRIYTYSAKVFVLFPLLFLYHVTQDALTSIVVFKVQDIKEKSQDYLSTARDLQKGWYVFGVRRRVVSCRVEL